jgi:NADPH-dependent 2,4-dienoyl-CoA reductase/sulfur reductase-like enzyme
MAEELSARLSEKGVEVKWAEEVEEVEEVGQEERGRKVLDIFPYKNMI